MRGSCQHEFELSDMLWTTWLYPASSQNYRNRFVQNLEVSPQGPASDVFQIKSQAALKRWIATRRHLPQTGEPWWYAQPLQISKVIALEVVDRMGPWPHQAHFTAHDVPELGQFVQAVAT